MTVEQGTGPSGLPSLCFVYNGMANPVIRIHQGQHLAIPLTNGIHNDDTTGTINCTIQTFVEGGDCAQPEAGFIARPGLDGSYYPIVAAVPHTADGTINLHAHGFETSPLPCHDEVIDSTLYPANWGAALRRLYTCQDTPSELSYSYDLPSDHPAGVYWYHPHRHGQEQAQQMMGASGPIVIEGDQDQLRAAHGVSDDVLMIRDLPGPAGSLSAADVPTQPSGAAVVASAASGSERHATPGAHRRWLNHLRAGQSPGGLPTPPLSNSSVDPRIDRENEVLCATDDLDEGGEEVTQLTLNGALVPEVKHGFPPDDQVLTKTMLAGERQVWRIINGTSQNIIVPKLVQVRNGVAAILPMTIIARDGVPIHDDDGTRRFEVRDTTKTPLLVPTAGRVEILVHAPPPGATLYLDSDQYGGGCASDGTPARRLLRVVSVGEGAAVDDGDIQPTGKETAFVNILSAQPEVYRVFAFTEYPRSFTVPISRWKGPVPGNGDFDPDGTDFYITMTRSSDGEAKSVAIHPFDMNGPPDVVVNLHGQNSMTEEWLVQNYTLEAHTFHIHQIHFRDISNGADNSAPALDTVVVPSASRARSVGGDMDRPDVPGFVRLRMTFTRASIGTFVFHCHIGEHVDNSMMQKISVVE